MSRRKEQLEEPDIPELFDFIKVQVVRNQYRVTIPKKIAEKWKLQQGTPLGIVLRDDGYYQDYPVIELFKMPSPPLIKIDETLRKKLHEEVMRSKK